MLGGVGFLGVLRLGDGAYLRHQSEQVNLDPVLLHLAVGDIIVRLADAVMSG